MPAIALGTFNFRKFSVRWQKRNRKWQEENKKVINKIAMLLHCFDENYYKEDGLEGESLFENRWDKRKLTSPENEDKKKEDKKLRERVSEGIDEFMEKYIPINFVSITYLLGILAVILIWLPSQ
ncbi:hypothetical protein GF406_21405 [candidate division KSB1 bacterium]|nr:hypothetical protein [candidate division KSB1 bacterium]